MEGPGVGSNKNTLHGIARLVIVMCYLRSPLWSDTERPCANMSFPWSTIAPRERHVATIFGGLPYGAKDPRWGLGPFVRLAAIR